ncbi:MAG: hypothetical protein J07HQW2_01843 [Haloquadratum walsbyi J07HQW2]|uniref:Uncharacterized protein n=1 Tax=Haloquadratum walsbyi J07HQW2 TaxID=1238425 RepID=U1NF47_9EURY|nr:MAG: hypothetical protein J07HQW2_01843 [Haloquadratum walsbyi J07HQW2]
MIIHIIFISNIIINHHEVFYFRCKDLLFWVSGNDTGSVYSKRCSTHHFETTRVKDTHFVAIGPSGSIEAIYCRLLR